MNRTVTNTFPRTVGTVATSKDSRNTWARITADDNVVKVTCYHGYVVWDEVTLTGHAAHGLAQVIAESFVYPNIREAVLALGSTVVDEPVITTEALVKGPLKYGKTYLVKKDGKTVGKSTFHGKRGGHGIWVLQDATGQTFALAFAGSLKDAAHAVASN